MMRYYKDITEILPLIFKSDLDGERGMRTHNADRIIGIVGSEGSGKSTLLLIYFEEWYKFLGKKVTEEMIEQICSNEEDFANVLPKVEEYDLIGLDEAVLSSYSRTSVSQGNVITNKFLMTCRGLKLKIPLLIPNILDLDSYIRTKRLTACYFVLPGYKVAYFSRKKLRTVLPKLAEQAKQGKYPDPMKCGVFPNFIAKFGKYDGILAKAYEAKKKAGMEKVKQMLLESLENTTNQPNKGADKAHKSQSRTTATPEHLMIKYALERGMPKADIYRALNTNQKVVDGTIKKIMQGFKYDKVKSPFWDYKATQQVLREISMGAHLEKVENKPNTAQTQGQILKDISNGGVQSL